jgi:hypothetical protein
VYEEILSAAGRRLRDEVDLVTFAMSMTALEEGLALRYLANPEAFKSDLTVAAKALSVGALALLAGASSPALRITTFNEDLRPRPDKS